MHEVSRRGGKGQSSNADISLAEEWSSEGKLGKPVDEKEGGIKLEKLFHTISVPYKEDKLGQLLICALHFCMVIVVNTVQTHSYLKSSTLTFTFMAFGRRPYPIKPQARNFLTFFHITTAPFIFTGSCSHLHQTENTNVQVQRCLCHLC